MTSSGRERLSVRSRARLVADRIDRRKLGVGRDDPELLLIGEGLLADRLVAHVEPALELLDPLFRRVMGCVAGTRRVVEEERLLRRDRLRVADELQRLVRDVLGEVVALLRRPRLVDGMVVVHEIGIPLVRLGAEEPVPALEPSAARPVPPRRREVHLVGRTEVPLPDHVRVPAALAEDLREHPVLRRDRAARVREPDRRLGDTGHAVPGVIPAGKEARARRRAQSRRVELRVANALLDDPVDVRRLDRPPVAAHSREAHVVEHDVQDVRRSLRRLRRLERRPVRLRIANIDVDRSVEPLAHARLPPRSRSATWPIARCLSKRRESSPSDRAPKLMRCPNCRQVMRTRCEHQPVHARPRAGHVLLSDPSGLRRFLRVPTRAAACERIRAALWRSRVSDHRVITNVPGIFSGVAAIRSSWFESYKIPAQTYL